MVIIPKANINEMVGGLDITRDSKKALNEILKRFPKLF